MIAIRLSRLGPKLWALCVLSVFAAGHAVCAQGLGPDPFRPYNNQYDAYTYPLGASGPDAALGAAMIRSGLRGANQYQNYLAEMQGLGRSGVEKYGQGLPYYRSVIDPKFDPDQTRDYRPNRKTMDTFQEAQQRLTAKYLAYFEERNPQKRAQLLKDYHALRRQTTRALGARRESPERFNTVTRADLGDGGRAAAGGRETEREKSTRRTSPPPLASPSSQPSARNRPRSPAPAPRGLGRSGSASGAPATPSDILDRARRMETLRNPARTGRNPTTGRTRAPRLPLDDTDSNNR